MLEGPNCIFSTVFSDLKVLYIIDTQQMAVEWMQKPHTHLKERKLEIKFFLFYPSKVFPENFFSFFLSKVFPEVLKLYVKWVHKDKNYTY